MALPPAFAFIIDQLEEFVNRLLLIAQKLFG
jgi:hypothetical protein